ncbi:hypothetical protein ACLOJK_018490 [Asimina triloba]
MPSKSSFFSTFLSLFLLLFHLGCFLFPPKTSPTKKRKLRKLSSSPPSPPKTQATPLSLLNPWPYLKPIFSFKRPRHDQSSKRCDAPPPPAVSRKRSFGSSSAESEQLSSHSLPNRSSSFTIRTDIFPCATCGEVFHKTQTLEIHQSTKHAVSELRDGDTAANIVRIIFQTGWINNPKEGKQPQIHRILKIHSSPKILSRFEEYRESVKMKSSRSGSSGGGRGWNERCVVDGNELLRFQCSTFMCSLGEEAGGGRWGICGGEFCSVCGIIRRGFSAKLDGIATMGSSRRAHESIPEEMEEEFAYMKVRRAMLVCRVVAGRVAREGDAAADDKESGGFDSLLVSPGDGGPHKGGPDHGEEELLVFNPRAVLPCFVVIYTV